MRSFIYTIEKSTRSRMYGSRKEIAKIYRLKKNKLNFLGRVDWNTASTVGEESEVLQELVRMGELPKKTLQESVSPCSGAGYYMRDNGNYSIKGI